MALNIPEEHVEALLQLANLTEVQFRQFVLALQSAPIEATPSRLAKAIAPSSPDVPVASLRRILLALFALFNTKRNRPANQDALPTEVVDTLLVARPTQFRGGAAEQLRSRLSETLTLEKPIGMGIRIALSLSNLTYALSTVNIYSDIKPVFRSVADQIPESLIVVHYVKLAYDVGGEDDDGNQYLTLALDVRDLERLRAEVERALKRDQDLKKWVEVLDVPVITPAD